ncbi:MAG: S8 family serine peptidase [Ferrovibrio sp.]|uniref:S8 family serine peptidase n=1 Tax=Ferrovibrio sp. TaxID=1917215 RepID=UPI002637D7A6|nr:S8 family serine peptidase [Ferrovibrio sp.]MCW0234358.1 S8 family serine peptidase [Ferrovibrio sp.]
MSDHQLRLLVKAHPQATAGQLALAGGKRAEIKLERLLPNIEKPKAGAALGAAARPVWFEAAAASGTDNAWDICHQLMNEGLGFAGQSVVTLAEPDLEQEWLSIPPGRDLLGLANVCGKPVEQDSDVYATEPSHDWFLNDGHSQLQLARAGVSQPSLPGQQVRIAHLDTGFDPQHRTLPKNLRRDLQRNFVSGESAGDASDQTGNGPLTNRGHGTATLALLAGSSFDTTNKPLGGAHQLEVVPIRVASSVLLFRNSAIAKALDYVHGLWDDPDKRVSVVTMSMGGLASGAWADAVNALYERGIFMVSAAGNNYGNLPTRYIVYPARFKRVVAACGVMADGRPWADLPIRKMAGCYGPRDKMDTAMAAYTPNVPWAKIGCPDLVDWDGNGTSSATPQVAAAAALWMQHHHAALEAYPEGWMRVEATRQALFDAAGQPNDRALLKYFGHGLLRAEGALQQQPQPQQQLHRQEEDSAAFALIRGLTGLGVSAPTQAQRMLELEALQISQRSHAVEQLLIEIENGRNITRQRLFEALLDEPSASQTLKEHLASELRRSGITVPVDEAKAPPPSAELPNASRRALHNLSPRVPKPQKRKLQVYASDPSAGTRLDSYRLNHTEIDVPWEPDLGEGPRGEYLDVVDIDPSKNAAYAPVDLNRPELLVQNGLPPSIGNPQFHQQMVYAVAMKTIGHFEHALGRPAFWAERLDGTGAQRRYHFVRRLRIYPHALHEANAFYSPEKRALLFGYFMATAADVGDNLPGGVVFTCLSHDIIVHETTHALLDGLHPRYKEPSGLDMIAFHEAFADVVALFQHFTMPDVLRDKIARSRGRLDLPGALGELAREFGQAIGERKALRDAVGTPPRRDALDGAEQPHARGAVLVAAIFAAFVKIYDNSTESLFRLATGGSGILPDGHIPYELTEQLAAMAAKIASRVLIICIRALDYCPPVDLTFGEYLRALITADRDLVTGEEGRLYRVAFIEAFRDRGIYPQGVNNLSADALCWEAPEFAVPGLQPLLQSMSKAWKADGDRYERYITSNDHARQLHVFLHDPATSDTVLSGLGLIRIASPQVRIIDGITGRLSRIEVHSVRPLRRVSPDGKTVLDNVVIEITQKFTAGGIKYRGGCTIICEIDTGKICYVIRKRVDQVERIREQQAFAMSAGFLGLQGTYVAAQSDGNEPFAMMHRHG